MIERKSEHPFNNLKQVRTDKEKYIEETVCGDSEEGSSEQSIVHPDFDFDESIFVEEFGSEFEFTQPEGEAEFVSDNFPNIKDKNAEKGLPDEVMGFDDAIISESSDATLFEVNAAPSNPGWELFLDFDFDEEGPKDRAASTDDPNILDDRARELVFTCENISSSSSSSRKFWIRRFTGLLEEFPHYQSFAAIKRLLEKQVPAETIFDAAEVKLYWQGNASLWLKKNEYTTEVNSIRSMRGSMSWILSAKLALLFGSENAQTYLDHCWKNEWLNLKRPSRFHSREYRNEYREYWNEYFYYSRFISGKAKLKSSELPVTWDDVDNKDN